MTRWALAAVLAVVGAWIAYGPLWRSRTGSSSHDIARPVAPARWALLLGTLRGLAYLCLLGLLLNAPSGKADPEAPLPVLDVSASWQRADDGQLWRAALDSLRAVVGDSVLLTGDSVRLVGRTDAVDASPTDQRSELQPALDRATALGRAVVIVSDGEPDDVGMSSALPPGSRFIHVEREARPDVAVSTLELPPYATGGDTVEVQSTLVSGGAGVEGGTFIVQLDGTELARAVVQPMEAFASRRVSVRVPLPRGSGERLLSAIATVSNDVEPRNDTLSTTIDITDRPRVVFVTTVPDLDVREVLRVLRGTVMLPARAYLRVAPGVWREEGTLAPITEAEVQRRAREAGLLVLHGDTAWSGIAAQRRGAMVLWTPAPPRPPLRAGEMNTRAEWFVSGAPPSPISAVLDGLPLDSLAPLDLGPALAPGGITLLEARAGRSGTPRAIASLNARGGARQLRISGSGFASWTVRSGRGADAFSAFWGAIFDWMAAAEGDGAGVTLGNRLVRAGESLVWRRGNTDSIATIVLRSSRGDVDSLQVQFVGNEDVARTSALPEGVYEVQVGATTRRLVVNPSREWVPRPPVSVPTISAAEPLNAVPRSLLERSWPFVLALLLLCAEWLLRRAAGLR